MHQRLCFLRRTPHLAVIALLITSITETGRAQHGTSEMSFQGYLTDDVGTPVTDAVPIVFKIYRGNTVLWTETHPSVSVENGMFSVVLGSVTVLDTVDFKRGQTLGIAVDGDPEMVPRTPLTAAAQAMNLRGVIRIENHDIGEFADNIVGGHGWVQSGAGGVTISGGGDDDSVDRHNRAYGHWATIAGGWGNYAGGDYNLPAPDPEDYQFATVSGGNRNTAFGSFSTIPGGYGNYAKGSYSYAAGRNAEAMHGGTFVWADSAGPDFTSTAGNQFLVRAAGGVGLGTPSPAGRLDVADMFKFQADETDAGNRSMRLFFDEVNANDTHGFSLIYAGKNAETHTFNGTDFSLLSNRFYIIRHTGSLGTAAGAVALTIERDTGHFGIGLQDPEYALDVDGQVRATNVSVISDGRYKENVKPLSGALDIVSGLRGVSYKWARNGQVDREFDTGIHLGFIAQEVADVLPNLVSQSESGIYSVSYQEIIPLLVEALKEQRAEMESLRQEIESLRADER